MGHLGWKGRRGFWGFLDQGDSLDNLVCVGTKELRESKEAQDSQV